MARWREHRVALLFLTGLALLGLVLAAEGATHGLLLYRGFAVGAGLVLVAPLAFALLLGERALRQAPRIGVSLCSLIAALLLAEGLVRWLGGKGFRAPELRYDAVLGHRHAGDRGEGDTWGFRNPRVPERADVVCLGDSQTWGFDVRARAAWPRELGRRTGLRVYNMGVGGYGPLQYLALAERALELEPRWILIGFFLGNDVAEAHAYAGLEHWSWVRAPGLSYPQQTSAFFLQFKPPANLALALVEGVMERSWLAWRVVDQTKLCLRTSRHLADLYWKEPGAPRYVGGHIATMFTPNYCSGLLDLRRESVRDGLRITRLALERIGAVTAERRVDLALLLLPTKEYCYFRHLQQAGDPRAEVLAGVAALEDELRQQVLALAGRLGLRVVDPLPDLLAALSADQPVWPASADGHFLETGCALLAARVQRDLLPDLDPH